MMKKVEEDFIKAHQKRFDAALARTTMSIRSNAAFVGLNKIREPLAFSAAMKAIGFPGIGGFAIPKGAGPPTRDVQELVDRAFTDAVEAATALPSTMGTKS